MKYLLTFLLMLLCGSSISAQERYFHELKGLEDSSGTTQLFYRLYEPKILQCSYESDGFTHHNEINIYKNHLRHFNLSTKSDSLFLNDYLWLRPFCETLPYNLMNYLIVEDDISNPYSIYRSVAGLTGGTWLGDIGEFDFDLGLANPMTMSFDPINNSLVISSPVSELIVKQESESNYDPIFKKSYLFPLDQDSIWKGKSYYDDYPDSLLIDFSVLGIVESENSVFVGYKDSDLVISYNTGNTYEVLYNNFFGTHPISETSFKPIIFDPAHPTFYIRNRFDYIFDGQTSDIIRVHRINDAWLTKNLLKDSKSKRISIDASNSGHLYLSDTTKVFFSEDYGENMQEILEFEEEVTGIYKKPDSDILYVLTKTDLYKVENGQPTSIKQIPVSNEESPEIPNAVSLKQNYPNPFNPTTTIEFELDKSTFTKLTVYDVVGRKVRELVNEKRPAGTNTIEFNATNLASGVYLYRLEANGVVQTKRLTLIK